MTVTATPMYADTETTSIPTVIPLDCAAGLLSAKARLMTSET